MKRYTQKTIKFYDAIADTYIKNGAAVVLKDKIDRFIKLLPGKKILDVACGPGHDTDYLTRKGFDCLGIDLSEKMIELARRNFKGKYEIMDFFDLKLRNDLFDGMWCSSIFVHIKKSDLPKLLKNSKTILKNNGIIGIITAQKQKRTKNKNDIRMYTMFEKKELENYLERAGFEILYTEIFLYGGKNRIFIISKKIY
ncbi:class I SAM-dependent methyltransferase [Patescibacteria group bacterium]|nr:class I SAM-dependent methyltransferase [Patescibacteria group bacterium]MBU4367750.1 class I SAM-dependent methyltransferase [Patescibacteria group bacterium]MBU4461800.1 class I SAM-dependent methyltransferase [Patescibacteria group bacterium]MCG2700069.1 class I SAM-dependent methyltransferase [Candidatus Parcubacteria bacterium]